MIESRGVYFMHYQRQVGVYRYIYIYIYSVHIKERKKDRGVAFCSEYPIEKQVTHLGGLRVAGCGLSRCGIPQFFLTVRQKKEKRKRKVVKEKKRDVHTQSVGCIFSPCLGFFGVCDMARGEGQNGTGWIGCFATGTRKGLE